MKKYTGKQVARMPGVSVHALHHYHGLGLLTPTLIGENRYRYYGERELPRLQQILFYRKFGIPLSEIATYFDRADIDHVAALEQHRARLAREAKHKRQLIGTIDRTIAQLKGERAMKHEDLYKSFSPEKQAEYQDQLVDAHGDGTARLPPMAASPTSTWPIPTSAPATRRSREGFTTFLTDAM